jgi:cytochrome c553
VKRIFVVFCLGIFWLAGSFAPAADGIALYKKACGGCHGGDGTQTPGGSAPIRGMPADALRAKLAAYAEGKIGGPAGKPMQDAARRAEKLSGEDRAALTEYIRGL